MYQRYQRVENRTHELTAFTAMALLLVGLAGCASDLAPMPNRPPVDIAPYVGAFTGEFVDGKPLYRFPAIEVVGWRSRVEPGT